MTSLFDEAELLRIFDDAISEISPICEQCGSRTTKTTVRDFTFRCSWSLCRHSVNILCETPFYHRKLSKVTILRILLMWIAKARISLIAELMGLSRQTVSSVIKAIKKPLLLSFYSKQQVIGGENVIVEIDESKFGKVKYHRGHRVEGVWVFGMVERTPERRIVLIPVDKRDKETLEKVIIKYVHRESIIYSDCWKAYNNLYFYFDAHLNVNHSKNFVDPITNVHTNTIEGNWSSIKDQVSITHRTKKHVEMYLIRYALKRNYGKNALKELIKDLF